MNKTIDLYEALRLMERSKNPFSVEFYKYSTTTQEGGDRKVMKNVLEVGQNKNINSNSMIAFREADKIDGEIRRCYIWLLNKYNDMKIVW